MVVPKVHSRPSEEQEARQPLAEAPPKPQVALADSATAAAGVSPARALQARLSSEIEASATLGTHWSPRRTLLFVLAVCGGFWAAVGAAAWLLIR